MVSGFSTSPKLFSRMLSGEASPMVIFEKTGLGRLSLLLMAIKRFKIFDLRFKIYIPITHYSLLTCFVVALLAMTLQYPPSGGQGGLIVELQIQSKTSQFMHQYVERFRDTRSRDVLAFHDRFVCFRTTNDVIR